MYNLEKTRRRANMAVRIISTTELRSKAADMVLGLRRGDRFLIQHYNDIVGFITPEIPSDLLKKLGTKGGKREEIFKSID
jgi:hypothetical protein